MKIGINNLTRKEIDEKVLKGLAKMVLKGENREKEISVAFVSKNKIRELNKKYRKKDEVTDVLSFGEDLNEIVICPTVIKSKKELKEVLIHGILHILGFNHGKLMEKKQNKYLK
jgi:probable rRNA maturation factor